MNMSFDSLINNDDVIKIAKSASQKFSYYLSKDEIENCILNAIWKASKKYDNKVGTKFTTYLYRGVIMECLTQNKFNNNLKRMKCIHNNIPQNKNNLQFIETIDQISKYENGKLLIEYYLLNKTVKELAKEYKVCGETIRLRLKKTINKIKNENDISVL